jgi:hypothetical protein
MILAARLKSCLAKALSLALFMFRVDADHTHHAFTVDDLALVADFLYRCSYLHNFSRFLAASREILRFAQDDASKAQTPR